MELTGAQPIPGLLLPTGDVTPGDRRPSTLRLRNAKVACAFQLKGKRILNLGCAWGLHSFYMAATANEVVGIDHSAKRIAIAESTKKALGVTNVHFKCGDFRDPQVFQRIPKFDLVIAWGFLHRIGDIFTLLHALTPMTDALSLEWRTPVLPYMSKLSLAYHPTVGKALNPKNVGPVRSEGNEKGTASRVDAERDHGQTGFWEPTPGAVAAICARFGYRHSRILGYGENFDSGSATVIGAWSRHMVKWILGNKPIHQLPLARIHMTLEKTPNLIEMRNPVGNDVELPDWDIALQKSIGKK